MTANRGSGAWRRKLGSAAALALFCLGSAHGAAGAATLRFLYDQTMGPPLVQLSSPETGMEVSGGLFLDLNRAIAKELGLDAVFVAQPRRRLEQVLQAGGADVLCFAHPAWAAEPDKLTWTSLYLNESTELVAAAGGAIPPQLEELPPGLVGTVTGYVYPEMAKAFTSPGVVRDDGPNDEVNLRKLLAGRTQYMVTHGLYLDYMLQQQPQSRAALGQRRVLRMFDTRCALGPKSVVSLRAFDAALQRLRASGAYEALLKRYR